MVAGSPDLYSALAIAALTCLVAGFFAWLSLGRKGGGSESFQRFCAAVDRLESSDAERLEAVGWVEGARVRFSTRVRPCELEVEVPLLREWSGTIFHSDLPPVHDARDRSEEARRLRLAAKNLDSLRVVDGWLIATLRNTQTPFRDSLNGLLEASRFLQEREPSSLGHLVRRPEAKAGLQAELALSAREPHGDTCPYCRGALEGEVRACAECETRQHSTCWDEHGGCTTFGCGRAARPRSEQKV